MLRHGLRFLTACQRRYGSVFTLHVAGFGHMVYLSDPAAIKTVFAGNPSVFHAGEANSMLAGLLGDSSLLLIDDDVHRDRRRLMSPPFHRDAVARQAGPIAEIAAANIAGWPMAKAFAVAPKMSEITLEVILRTVIGASDPVRLAALRKVMPRLLNVGPWATLALANPSLLNNRLWSRLRRRIEEADALLYAEIADRRADPDLAARTDTLAMLVRAADEDGRTMTERELRDQLITLLVAGHDTTATGLSWALERLTRHPATSTWTRWPKRHCGSARWCTTWAGSSPRRWRWPVTGCRPGSWWSQRSGWCTRARNCIRIRNGSTLIGWLAPL